MRFTAELARLLEMQHLIPAYMKGWTVRTDVPRGCNRLPNFLTQGAPPRARELHHHYLQWLQITCDNHVNLALDSFSQQLPPFFILLINGVLI